MWNHVADGKVEWLLDGPGPVYLDGEAATGTPTATGHEPAADQRHRPSVAIG